MFFSDAPPSGTAAPAGAPIAGYAGPRRRILVTDDDPAHPAMVRTGLAPLGFGLAFAGNGAACLAARPAQLPHQAGRASGRARVRSYVSISVVPESINKTKKA